LKKPITEKGWWNAPGVGPEFKPQCCKKKKKMLIFITPNISLIETGKVYVIQTFDWQFLFINKQ
jgi:hypothetical protein